MAINFNRIIQFGVVTDDLEGSIEQYKKFGLKKWGYMQFRPENFPPVVTQDGGPVTLNLDIGVCQLDCGIELELIRPNGENVFTDYLRSHGPGVHHIAWKIPGYQEFMADYVKTGMGSIVDISDPTGTRGFTYLDTYDALGYYCEVHRGQPGAPEDDGSDDAEEEAVPDTGMDFNQAIQVIVVTEDLEAALKQYEAFGLTEWRRMRFSPEILPWVKQNGGAPLAFDGAVCPLGDTGVEMEICQPHPGSLYAEWMAQHGPGIHHLTFKVPDYAAFMKAYDANGGKRLADFDMGDACLSFVDTYEALGFLAEIKE